VRRNNNLPEYPLTFPPNFRKITNPGPPPVSAAGPGLFGRVIYFLLSPAAVDNPFLFVMVDFEGIISLLNYFQIITG